MTTPPSRVAAAVALSLALLALGPPAGGLRLARAGAYSVLTGADATQAVSVPDSATLLAGRHLSSQRVVEIASALPAMQQLVATHPGAYPSVYTKGARRWQVSFFTRGGAMEIGQVLVDDASGRVLEAWTGFQVAWAMARGYPGAFGEAVDSVWIWIPLSVLFVAPFVDWRRPRRILHLDLLALSSFSVSLAFFNHADIGASTPLAYPALGYLLVRMLIVARPGRRARARPLGGGPAGGDTPRSGALWLRVPPRWLAGAVVVLVAFRIVLNVLNANVIDVGYAGVIGAQRIVHGQSLYGGWPSDNPHGDTYGPVSYEAYIPFVALFGWSGHWDDLPAAHGASVFFDLLALVGLFLLGRRVRGPTLGLALAYAWASYPFTLFALESDTNDSLVAALVIAALLTCTSAGRRPARAAAAAAGGWRMAGRGALAALAALTKFAPLALAPLLATEGLHGAPRRRRVGAVAAFTAAFALCGAVVSVPALDASSLHTFIQRTLVYQANRDSPFSVWGLYGGLSALQAAVQAAALVLALVLALGSRRRDAVGLAASAAAILIAAQLGVDHWFYLYLPWFFGPAMLALICNEDVGAHSLRPSRPGAAGGSARSRQLAAA